MFGTFKEEDEPCVYGSRTPLKSWNPLWAVGKGYADIAALVAHTRRWSDKLRLLWKPSGWLADEVQSQEEPYDLQAAAQRYDPPLSLGSRLFGVLQFLLLAAGAGGYLWFAESCLMERLCWSSRPC